MFDNRLLIAAMAEKCRDLIRGSNEEETRLPLALHPKHLLWMCAKISKHAEDWPATKLHRWIGAIQCAILANRMLTIEQVRKMFEGLRQSHNLCGDDQDLVDHLDPTDSFKIDIGGQG